MDLPVDAHVPHDYVAGERLRLEAYRKIAEAADQDALDAIVEELTDRYGEPPTPVRNLLAVAAFRQRCRAMGVAEVAVAGNNVRDRPGRAAGLRAAAAAPAAPEGAVQGGGEAGHGAAAGRGRPDRRRAAARRRAARLVRRADRRRTRTDRRRQVTPAGGGSTPTAMPDSAAAPRSGSGAAGGGRTGAGTAVTGGLRRFGRRYPAVGRAAVGVLCAVAARSRCPRAVPASPSRWPWPSSCGTWSTSRRCCRTALLPPVPGDLRGRRCPGLRPVPGQAGPGGPGTAGRVAGLGVADRVVHRRRGPVPAGRPGRCRRDGGRVRRVPRRSRGVAGTHGVGRPVRRRRGLDGWWRLCSRGCCGCCCSGPGARPTA